MNELPPAGGPLKVTEDTIQELLSRAPPEARPLVARFAAQQRELARLARLYEALSQVNQAIVRTRDRGALFQQVCEALVNQGGFAMSWIGMHDPASRRLVPAGRAGDETGYVDAVHVYTDERPEGRGPSGRAFREGRTIVTANLREEPSASPWQQALAQRGLQGSAALPIRQGGEVLGTLNVYASEIDFFGTRELSLLEEVVRDVSFALDNMAREAERARADAAAESERSFSSSMLESMPGVVYFYDQGGRFLRWNRNFEVVSGYSGAEIAGMSPLDFFRGPDHALIAERISRVFESGESSVEADFISKDGTARPYFFTGRRLEFQGRPCLVGVGMDVSQRRRSEEELRQSEARFRTTVESLVEGCQLISFDWTYLYLNATAAVHNRRPNAELLRRTMLEAWPGIEGTPVFALLRRCMQERLALHDEVEFAFADGSRNWFDVRCQPVPEGIFVLSIDIGERKRDEAERARLVEELRAALLEAERARATVDHILESVTDAFVTLDRNWNCTYVNERAARIFGRTREQLLGKHIWTEFPEGVGKPFHRAYERAMREGVAFQFEEYDPPSDAWFENRIYPSQDGISIVFQDITERKRAEQALHEAKAELERKVQERTAEIEEARRFTDALIDDLPNPLFYKDARLRFLGCNRAYERAFGVSREQLIGKTVLELQYLAEADRRRYQEEQLALLAGGVPVRYEAEMPLADGRSHQTLYEVSAIRRPDGSAAGVVGSIVDITPLKEAEAALERAMHAAEAADRTKSAFLATMSHELRTPLNSIIGFTGIVLQGLAGPLNPEQTKQLGMVRASARHLLELINDVLDISKIEAGQMEVRAERFELQPSLQRAIASVQHLAEHKQLGLSLEAPPEPRELVTDQRRLEQILINLLNNAVKFTSQGEVKLRVELLPEGNGPQRVRLSVSDTGPGIRPEDQALLFQPFRQIDSGLTRAHEGTGLGLAICRRLAHLLGGEIELESAWGAGSTFRVTLPVRLGPP